VLKTSESRTIALTARIATPVGAMVAAATEDYLILFEFDRRERRDEQFARACEANDCVAEPGDNAILTMLRTQLDEYFAGDRRDFTVPLLAPGTPFQEQVWTALRQIPCGSTTSYGRLAQAIGKPDHARAVARANGDNRIAILIPCHRVIGSDGSLVGYGGGLSTKRKLLDLEGRGENLSLFD
jgi:O-6-methylguanine DNA methyltransferase